MAERRNPNALAGSSMQATPRKNVLAGYAADALGAVDQFARRPFGYDNPPAAMASDFLSVPAIQRTLDRVSYGEPLTNGRGLTTRMRPDTVDAVMAAAPVVAKWPKQALGAASALAGGSLTDAQRAAILFHGSPAKFDAFKAAKIGSGEGAQIYGHGTYFAESPEVASWYARKLSEPKIKFSRDAADEVELGIQNALLSVAKNTQANSRQQMVNEAYNRIVNPMRDRLYGNAYAGIKPLPPDELEAALKRVEAAKSLGNPTVGTTGSLYTVDVPDAKIEKMLDWDNGGQEIYEDAVSRLGSHKKAAAELRKQGIPGIRYLDGDSRAGGKGTNNYVLFPGEEKSAKILSRE